jgi:hypothetical protein
MTIPLSTGIPNFIPSKDQQRYCLDCHDPLSKTNFTIRCKKCSNRENGRLRRLANGRTIDSNYRKCIDCHVEIDTQHRRCKKCNQSHMKIKMKGSGNSHYIDGRTNKCKCIVCGVKVTFPNKRCLGHVAEFRRTRIITHHIDLDHSNDLPSNKLRLTQSQHSMIHQRAYYYLVKLDKINEYVEWFKKTCLKESSNGHAQSNG